MLYPLHYCIKKCQLLFLTIFKGKPIPVYLFESGDLGTYLEEGVQLCESQMKGHSALKKEPEECDFNPAPGTAGLSEFVQEFFPIWLHIFLRLSSETSCTTS